MIVQFIDILFSNGLFVGCIVLICDFMSFSSFSSNRIGETVKIDEKVVALTFICKIFIYPCFGHYLFYSLEVSNNSLAVFIIISWIFIYLFLYVFILIKWLQYLR
jgi:hypothetical protein